jgi:cytochrome P450
VQRLAAYGEPVEGTPFGRYRLIELLLLGGIDPVTAVMGFAMLALAADPQLRSLLRADPEQV